MPVVEDPFTGFLSGYIQAKEQRRQEALEKARMIMENQRQAIESRRVEIDQERQIAQQEHWDEMERQGAKGLDIKGELAQIAGGKLDLAQATQLFKELFQPYQEEQRNARAGARGAVGLAETGLRGGGDVGQMMGVAQSALSRLGVNLPGMPQDQGALPLPAAQTRSAEASATLKRAQTDSINVNTDVMKRLREAETKNYVSSAHLHDIQAKESQEMTEARVRLLQAQTGQSKANTAEARKKTAKLARELREAQERENGLKKKGLWLQYLIAGKKDIDSLKSSATKDYATALMQYQTTLSALSKMGQGMGDLLSQMNKFDVTGASPDPNEFNRVMGQRNVLQKDIETRLSLLSEQEQILKSAKARKDYYEGLKLESGKAISPTTGKVNRPAQGKIQRSVDQQKKTTAPRLNHRVSKPGSMDDIISDYTK